MRPRPAVVRRVKIRRGGSRAGDSAVGDGAEELVQGAVDVAVVFGDEGRSWRCGIAQAPPTQDEAAQEHEVGGRVAGATAVFIFEERGVPGMMIFVLDAGPALPWHTSRVGGRKDLRGNKDPASRAGLAGFLLRRLTGQLDQLRGMGELDFLGPHGQLAQLALVDAPVPDFEA